MNLIHNLGLALPEYYEVAWTYPDIQRKARLGKPFVRRTVLTYDAR
ncbi:MAG TPA: hypothetical protein VLF40_05320 [Candidatus Saccharimonadales bacterium]|nr:hypothetical protein [Candidatus Saccharimonadales bacterium]